MQNTWSLRAWSRPRKKNVHTTSGHEWPPFLVNVLKTLEAAVYRITAVAFDSKTEKCSLHLSRLGAAVLKAENYSGTGRYEPLYWWNSSAVLSLCKSSLCLCDKCAKTWGDRHLLWSTRTELSISWWFIDRWIGTKIGKKYWQCSARCHSLGKDCDPGEHSILSCTTLFIMFFFSN